MSDFLVHLITQLGTTAIIVATLGWVGKSIASHFLSRNLDLYAIRLRQESDKQINELKFKFEKILQENAAELLKEGNRAERVRVSIDKWSPPILGAVKDLRSRLQNIIN